MIAESGHDVRTSVGEIDLFPGVGSQIEEFEVERRRYAGVEFATEAGSVDEFPVTRAHHDVAPADRRIPAMGLDHHGPIRLRHRLLRFTSKRAEQTSPIESRIRNLKAARLEHGRNHVEVHADHAPAGARFEPIRPADEERRPDPALEDRPLASAKARREAVVIGTVVVQVDDDRVVPHPRDVDRIEHPADVPVEVGIHREDPGHSIEVRSARAVQVAGLVVGQFGGRHIVERAVRRIRGQHREERPRLIVHPVDHLVDVDVGAPALEGFEHAVPQQDRIGVSAFATFGVRGLGDAAATVDDRPIKSLVARSHRRAVAQVPLAEDPGRVSRRTESLGDRDLLRAQHRAPDPGVERGGALGVPSSQERRPRGRAHRMHVEGLERCALRGESVDPRRLENRMPLHPEISEPLVVGHDDHDVRAHVRRRNGLQQRETHDQSAQVESTHHRAGVASAAGRRCANIQSIAPLGP